MYMYSKLKEAIYGVKGNQTKDWSPNAIRAMVITYNFMFVAYHTKQPRVIPLDVNESAQDLQKNGSSGSLTNLLKQKQLSCMEEFYVDPAFQNYTGVLDLNGYVNSLVNSRSRLRSYGYIQTVDPSDLVSKFSNAMIQSLSDYLYVLDKTRVTKIQYTMTNNDNWFAKYNLRPNDYKLDIQGGTLHKYFTRVENEVSAKYQAQMEKLREQGIDAVIKKLYATDLENVGTFTRFFAAISLLNKTSWNTKEVKFAKDVVNEIKNHAQKISVNQLKGRVQPNNALLNLYNKLGVFADTDMVLSLDELAERAKFGDGFTGIKKSFEVAVKRYVSEINRDKGSSLVSLVIIMRELGYMSTPQTVCEDVKGILDHEDWFMRYVCLMFGLSGNTEESAYRYVSGK